jgi:hypothetical protein
MSYEQYYFGSFETFGLNSGLLLSLQISYHWVIVLYATDMAVLSPQSASKARWHK